MKISQKNGCYLMYIITPCRNAAATISETIDSIISQSSVSPIYYHVQDGLSSDGTQDILAGYQERLASDPAHYGHIVFSWVSEPDVGMYDAISKAVDKLNIQPNDFMGWLNADDLLCPNTISTIHEIERNLPNIDWVGGVRFVMDMNRKILFQGRKFSRYPRDLLLNGLCDGLHWHFLQQEGTFWRKRIWNAAGGLNTQLRFAGDWDLWRRMACYGEYTQLTESTGIFRKRPGQLSAGSSYYNELDSILSKTNRRNSLYRLLRSFPFMRVKNLIRNPNGVLTLQEGRLRLYWKDIVRLCLVSLSPDISYGFVARRRKRAWLQGARSEGDEGI